MSDCRSSGGEFLYLFGGRQRALRPLARHGRRAREHGVGDSLFNRRASRELRRQSADERVSGSGSVHGLYLGGGEVLGRASGGQDRALRTQGYDGGAGAEIQQLPGGLVWILRFLSKQESGLVLVYDEGVAPAEQSIGYLARGRQVEQEPPSGLVHDASRVEILSDASTGSAFITVTPDGENTIIVSPGANRSFGPEEIEAANEDLRRTRILVAQLEIHVEAVETAARAVEEAGGRFLLNLAPPREVSDALLRWCDPLVVNENEARFLLGEGAQNLEESAGKLLDLGPRSAVITLGAEGAILAVGGSTQHFPAPKVEAVDTTGAGDAFVGALAAKLARGAPLEEAVPYAVLAGAAAVTSEGAQGSLPTPAEVEKLDVTGTST